MENERIVVKGVILRATDTKDADKMLTVLTGERGKLSVVARGARRRTSRIAAASQLFVYSEMVLCERRGWYMLDEAATLCQFSALQNDLSQFALASYFAELTESLTQEEIEAHTALSLFLNALYALETLQKPSALVKAAFTLRLLCLAGYEPLLDACAYCDEVTPQRPMLDVLQGILRCAGCGTGSGGLSMPLCPASLAAMRHIVSCEPKRLYSFTLPDDALARLDNAAEAFCAAQLERGFRTLDYYKALQI
ncbi:MAG: DNA repair protein RecO [Oscillospiraceae bacterium]|nr:DNA repair protein RecO [Oscillospiraceae bacterium]